ncbi:MAG: hypothetical protein A3H96_24805 [Acidobacteria bacterium RIFCSPLOWO2_02_FULL_67_36]|nr:MAG: hypothetical protein A3H96_24805 [Acidobacteria bacterium RIFCSPLOWO2_02_FULL_67_36]
MQYGALQSALETETALQLAAAWDPVNRTIVSTSLSTRGRLTVLAPSDVSRLPAGSAGALRSALTGGEMAVVPGEVATAKTWWTVGRSGFVRAIVEPGGGMVKNTGKLVTNRYAIKRVGAVVKAGQRPPGGGNEGAMMQKQGADSATTVGEASGDAVRSFFRKVYSSGFEPVK